MWWWMAVSAKAIAAGSTSTAERGVRLQRPEYSCGRVCDTAQSSHLRSTGMKRARSSSTLILGIIVSGLALTACSSSATNTTTSSAPATSAAASPASASPTAASGSATASTSPSASPSGSTGVYTLAEVATHNKQSDCWTAINGKVYDVTSWATKHPGGDQNIYRLCGIDGTSAFSGQHGSQSEPNETLAEYQIGVLG